MGWNYSEIRRKYRRIPRYLGKTYWQNPDWSCQGSCFSCSPVLHFKSIQASLTSVVELNALFFFRFMILDRPNCFGRVQIVLVGSNLFLTFPNHFGQVQIRFLWTDSYSVDLIKIVPWFCWLIFTKFSKIHIDKIEYPKEIMDKVVVFW